MITKVNTISNWPAGRNDQDSIALNSHAVNDNNIQPRVQPQFMTLEPHKRTLVVVDAQLPQLEVLLQGMETKCDLLFIEPHENALLKISEALKLGAYQRLCVVAHGAPGCVYLGSNNIDAQQLQKNADCITQWELEHIDLYSCFVLQDSGFMSAIEALSGAVVAASDQRVGHENKGGTWELSQAIAERDAPFSRQVCNQWRHTLQAPTILSAATTKDGAKINLSFDKTLEDTSNEHFTVTSHSVTQVQVYGLNVELTLQTPVNADDDSVKVTYTPSNSTEDVDNYVLTSVELDEYLPLIKELYPDRLQPAIIQAVGNNGNYNQFFFADNYKPNGFWVQVQVPYDVVKSTVNDLKDYALGVVRVTTADDISEVFDEKKELLIEFPTKEDIVKLDDSTMTYSPKKWFKLGPEEKAVLFLTSDYSEDGFQQVDFDVSIEKTLVDIAKGSDSGPSTKLYLTGSSYDSEAKDPLSKKIAKLQKESGKALFDFKSIDPDTVEVDIAVSREADFSSTFGFYKVVNEDGDVMGDDGLVSVGDSNYASVALKKINLVAPDHTIENTINLKDNTQIIMDTQAITTFDNSYVAMYATVKSNSQEHDDKTYFSFQEANPDKKPHFKIWDNHLIGFEDQFGGGDNDFDDLLIHLTFTDDPF